MTVYWDRIPAPIGIVYASVNENGYLTGITWKNKDEPGLRWDRDPPGRRDQERLAHVRRQLKQYFNGSRCHFQIEVDGTPYTDFQKRVYDAVGRIPYGTVRTYKEVAIAAGSPRAARAVGHALSRNAVPIVIPCHRVVAGDGGMRGFSAAGGIDTKRWLLRHEGAVTAK